MPFLLFSRDESGKPAILIDRTFELIDNAEALVAAHPILAAPAGLGRYCDAINYLDRGGDFHVIHDPAAWVEKYEKRLHAENPEVPFVEGVARASDFGVCETSEIAPPQVSDATVVFYAEQDFLGLPYRVTGPAPTHAGGELQYEPLTARQRAESD